MICQLSRFIPALALMLSAITSVDFANAQERLRVAWAGGASNAAVSVVQEKGLLKKQGVNAEFISVNASPMALQAMIAGEVDVIVTSVTTLVNARLTGADVVMIASIVPTFPAHIITQKNVMDIKQLKGKIGGVGRAGTTTEIGMRLGSQVGNRPQHGSQTGPGGSDGGRARRAFQRSRPIFYLGRTVCSRGRKTRFQVPGRHQRVEHPVSLDRSPHPGTDGPIEGFVDDQICPSWSKPFTSLKRTKIPP